MYVIHASQKRIGTNTIMLVLFVLWGIGYSLACPSFVSGQGALIDFRDRATNLSSLIPVRRYIPIGLDH